MSRRDTDRDRRAAASARTNEYFVPKDGIDREVITADICRYLGNDALVRPGVYENPSTRTPQQGYFINAYRNLTTAMIADLKLDSERWEAERRQTAASSSRGQPISVGYRESATHQTRQYYGPSTESGQPGGYPQGSSAGAPMGNAYDSGSQYQQPAYAQPPSGYAQPQGYPVQDNYYVAGADLRADLAADQSRSRVPVSAGSVNVPRSNNYGSSSTPTYQQPPEPRAAYYSGPPPTAAQAQPVYASPQDQYYGRAVPVTGASYDTQDAYDRGYPETAYSQAPTASSSSIPATSNTSSRREHQREPDRDSRSHHSSGGGRRR